MMDPGVNCALGLISHFHLIPLNYDHQHLTRLRHSLLIASENTTPAHQLPAVLVSIANVICHPRSHNNGILKWIPKGAYSSTANLLLKLIHESRTVTCCNIRCLPPARQSSVFVGKSGIAKPRWQIEKCVYVHRSPPSEPCSSSILSACI